MALKACKLVYTAEEAKNVTKFQGIPVKFIVGPNGCVQLLFVEDGKDKEETICTGEYVLNLDRNKKYQVVKIPAEGYTNDESSGSLIQQIKPMIGETDVPFKYTFKEGSAVPAPASGLDDFPKATPTNWQEDMPELIARLNNTLNRLESFLEVNKF